MHSETFYGLLGYDAAIRIIIPTNFGLKMSIIVTD